MKKSTWLSRRYASRQGDSPNHVTWYLQCFFDSGLWNSLNLCSLLHVGFTKAFVDNTFFAGWRVLALVREKVCESMSSSRAGAWKNTTLMEQRGIVWLGIVSDMPINDIYARIGYSRKDLEYQNQANKPRV